MKKNTGITLIALIITIIIMLILVAVSVAILIKGNLVGKARGAGIDTQQAYEQEQTLGDSININGTMYNSIDEYISSDEPEVYEPIALYLNGQIHELAGDFILLPRNKYYVGTFTKDANSMRMYRKVASTGNQTWDGTSIYTTNKIPLRGYTKIKVNFSTFDIYSCNSSQYPYGSTVSICISNDNTTIATAWSERYKSLDIKGNAPAFQTMSSPGEYVLDISEFTDTDTEAYVGIMDRGSTYVGIGAELVITSIIME